MSLDQIQVPLARGVFNDEEGHDEMVQVPYIQNFRPTTAPPAPPPSPSPDFTPYVRVIINDDLGMGRMLCNTACIPESFVDGEDYDSSDDDTSITGLSETAREEEEGIWNHINLRADRNDSEDEGCVDVSSDMPRQVSPEESSGHETMIDSDSDSFSESEYESIIRAFIESDTSSDSSMGNPPLSPATVSDAVMPHQGTPKILRGRSKSLYIDRPVQATKRTINKPM